MSFIETPRLFLRTWMLPGDAVDGQELFDDEEVMRYIPHSFAKSADSIRIIEFMTAMNEREGFGFWPVIAKGDGALVGECGLARIDDTPQIEIGWMFKRKYWGNGYATESARAVLDYAFEHLRAPRVYALIDRMNARSIAVANRLGMTYDRIVRQYHQDLMRYVKEQS